jgi:glycosyltransferase involved in cell wall biosynthesis
MGADVLCSARAQVPIDLVGIDATSAGGVGEVAPPELAAFQARYRFAFSPVRQTSMALAIIEAMMIGLPIVGVATCELASVVRNGESGYVDSSLPRVLDAALGLIGDPGEARRLGEGARRVACDRYNIGRFTSDWDAVLREVAA